MGGWSHSQYKSFATCPKKIGYRRKGVYEPYNPAMARGNRIHKDAENYLNKVHKNVPATLANFKDELSALRRKKPVAEQEVAVDENWNPVSWKSSKAWLRYKVDAQYDRKDYTTVIDFKTGRVYPEDHEEQLELYALGAVRTQGAKRVIGEAWYFDQDHIQEYLDYPLDLFDEIEARWRKRAEKLLYAEDFPATPGRHCDWCGYSMQKGSPCEDG